MKSNQSINPQSVIKPWLFVLQKLQRIRLPRPVMIGLVFIITILLGVGLGFALMSPAALILASIVTVSIYLFIIASNPIGGVAFWLVLYPYTETRLSIDLGEGIPDLSPTRFVVAFLIAILLGQAATGQRRFPRITLLDLACLLLVIGIGVSAGASHNPITAFQLVLDIFLVPAFVYYVIKNFVQSKKDLDLVFNAILIIGVYSCIFLFQEWITGNLLFVDEGTQPKFYDSGVPIVQSLWGGPSVYTSIFAMAIPLAFYRVAKAENGSRQLLYSLLLVLFLVGQAFTFKRAGWVASLVSFIIIFPFFPSFRKMFLAIFVIIGIPTAIFWNSLSSNDMINERVNNRLDTLNGRTNRWEIAIELWKEKPITGHGFSNFDKLSGFEAVENFYLHLLVSGGLLAFLPFVAITILAISESIRIFIRGPSNPNIFVDRDMIAVFWGMFSTYLVKAMTGAQGRPIVTILLFVIIAAVVGSQGEQLDLYKKGRIRQAGG